MQEYEEFFEDHIPGLYGQVCVPLVGHEIHDGHLDLAQFHVQI